MWLSALLSLLLTKYPLLLLLLLLLLHLSAATLSLAEDADFDGT